MEDKQRADDPPAQPMEPPPNDDDWLKMDDVRSASETDIAERARRRST